jgi:hypothetical protein
LLVLPNWREDFQKKNLIPIGMGSVPAWHSKFCRIGRLPKVPFTDVAPKNWP